MKIWKHLTISAGLMVAAAMPALADDVAEKYVYENANAVLQTLNQPSLSDADRTAQFVTYMDTFSDIDKIARYVLGSTARELSDAEFDEYLTAFKTYAMAVYEVELDKFRGENVEVVSSYDYDNSTKYDISDVETKVRSAQTGEDMTIEWRVQKRKTEDASAYKVMDVALDLNGSQVWLGAMQRAQFESILKRSNFDINVLIDRINGMTAKLQASKTASTEATDDNG